MFIIFCYLGAFILGSIPIGYLIGRANGLDIRSQGSGNTGATNTARVLGRKAGAITLIGDILKGAIPVAAAHLLFATSSYTAPFSQLFPASLGLAAVFGHCFSPFLGFKGGKGVATGLGAFIVLCPLEAVLSIAVFVVVLKLFRYVSLSSMAAAAALPLFILIVGRENALPAFVASFLTSSLVIVRHKANILRLREGSESKF